METTENKTWRFKSIYGEYIAEIKNDKLCLLGKKFTFNKTDVLKIPNISRITTTAGDRVYPISRVSYFIKIGCCEITYKQLQEIQYEFKRKETQVQNKTIEIKKYKHTSGKIAIQIADTNLYQVQGSENKLAEWLLIDSQDWKEIKEPEFQINDYVFVISKNSENKLNVVNKIFKVIPSIHFDKNLVNLYVEDQISGGNNDGGYYLDKKHLRLATEKEVDEYFKPKEGDYMIYTKNLNPYWFKGKIFRFKEFKNGYVYEIGNKYESCCSPNNCRKATPEEIQRWKASNEIKIGKYVFENNNGLAQFGCQEFSKSELIGIKKLFNVQINACIILHPDIGESLILTPEFLTKVIDKL